MNKCHLQNYFYLLYFIISFKNKDIKNDKTSSSNYYTSDRSGFL